MVNYLKYFLIRNLFLVSFLFSYLIFLSIFMHCLFILLYFFWTIYTLLIQLLNPRLVLILFLHCVWEGCSCSEGEKSILYKHLTSPAFFFYFYFYILLYSLLNNILPLFLFFAEPDTTCEEPSKLLISYIYVVLIDLSLRSILGVVKLPL